jgi:uncharacterized membrane protein
MFRKQLAGRSKEHKDRIIWRSHEVTRIEAFSDAVFAFAVTLLIVSLEVPKSLTEMLESMNSFLPFAVCFAMLFQVWLVQNIFFRRYGLNDTGTLILNAMLLFTVLFFVYPLKFLFSALMLHGYTYTEADVPKLYYIYGGGFATIYFLFTLMYWNALRHRQELGLTDSEAFETKTNIYRNLVMALIGLLSIGLAWMGGNYTAWAGICYMLIGPAIALTHSHRGKKHRKKFSNAAVSEVRS